MNLQKLFEAQRVLDDRIVKEKALQGQDLLDKKILALQVELGELANEWRGFKFWSEDREPNDFAPNVYDVCKKCDGEPTIYSDDNSKIESFCEECDGVGFYYHNPLLEEYVDNLHFILSIGLEYHFRPENVTKYFEKDITKQFNSLFWGIMKLSDDGYKNDYDFLIGSFMALGEMLGFKWDDVVQAYFDKNKINHERQDTGY